MSRLWSLICVALIIPLAEAQAPTPEAAALARAEAAAVRFGGTLKAKVVETMGSAGPAATVDVCATEAPRIKAAIEAETGVTLGRSSLRLRNPANAGPDWVQAWLSAQGERPAAGLTGVSVVEGGQARVLKPIAVEAPCLVCHGDPAGQPAELRARLQARYPQDRATGYQPGDLRGALWATAPVGP